MTTANSRDWHRKSWAFTAFALSGVTLAFGETALAQVIPDNTLGKERSVVTPLDPQVDRIDGGAMRGTSLFHSFAEFNIGEGRGAYFANPTGIETIFSRVTGSNPSNLLGTLGILGNANLFFINPNGILFGLNASLDIRGSFVASTASSVTLPDGSNFSATNPQAPPLLTVDVRAPIGLQFEGGQPGVIVNAGNLTVEAGQNITLAAGTVASTGILSAPEGEIAITTVSGAGTEAMPVVQLEQEGQLLGQTVEPLKNGSQQVAISAISWPEAVMEWGEETGLTVNPEGQVELTESGLPVEVGDIAVQQLSAETTNQVNGIDTSSINGSGSIILDSRSNITLSNSEIDASTKDGDAGDITLIAQEEVSLSNSRIINQTVESGEGNTGDITIKTGSLVVSHSSDTESILSRTLGQGDTGNVTIQATESIFFNQGAKLLAGSGEGSQGNGGNVTIRAAESIFFNEGSALFAGGTGGSGDGGDVTIQADNGNISFTDGAFISANSSGEGNAGTITIQANNGNISFTNKAYMSNVSSLAQASGNAGNVVIRANQGNISFTNSEINANTVQQGNGGEVTIQADNGSVSLSNAGIFATTAGKGNGGNIAIQAAEEITVDGASSRVFTGSDSEEEGRSPLLGNSGNVDLRARSITISNDGRVEAGTAGQGNGGRVTIQAADSVMVKDANVETQTSGEGDAGSVRIQAGNSITIEGNGFDIGGEGIFSGSRRLDGSPEILGNGGEVELIADSVFFNELASLVVSTEGQGTGGNANIQARDSVLFTNGARVLADTISSGNGGSIRIHANNAISFDGKFEDINTAVLSRSRQQPDFPDPTGNGGEITLSARSILFSNEAEVRADTVGSGKGGSIILQATDTVSFSSSAALSSDTISQTSTSASGGTITIQSGDAIALSDGAIASARTLGVGKGGSVTIQADGIFSVDDAQATVSSFESGDAGELGVDAKFVLLDNEGQLTATARVSNGGNIGVQAENILLMRRGSLISARSEGLGSADGNIDIDAGGIIAFPGENSDIIARSANRGDIDIDAQAIFGFQVNEALNPIPESELSATGDINLNLGVDPTRGLTALPEEPRSTDVAEGCQASDGQDTVQFYNIGRGGTPSSPDDPLNADTLNANFIPLDSETADENGKGGAITSNQETIRKASPRLAPPCQNR